MELFVKKAKKATGRQDAAFQFDSKAEKLKTALPQTVGRVILWIMVAFLLLRGIGSILRPDPVKAINSQVTEFKDALDREFRVASEASAFAEGFAREYLTYKGGDGEEYKRRLAAYAPSRVVSASIDLSNNDRASRVTDTQTVEVQWHSDSQVNILVQAKVVYTISQAVAGEPEVPEAVLAAVTQVDIKEDNIYIKIPVYTDGRRYVVEDLPVFVPRLEKAEVQYTRHSGTAAGEEEAAAINEMLKNFFRTYYEGSDSELTYYMSDPGAGVKGMGGKFKFKGINEVLVYEDSSAGGYIALAEVLVADPNTLQEIRQGYHINIMKKDSRFYIAGFDTRMGNLQYKEDEDNGEK